MPIGISQSLDRALAAMLDKLDDAVENTVTRTLVRHAVIIHYWRSGDTRAYFDAVRETSRANLGGACFDPASPEANETIRTRALQRHDRIFVELARAVGLGPAEPAEPEPLAAPEAPAPTIASQSAEPAPRQPSPTRKAA